MKYLLDTDICIFFLQGKFSIKDKIKEVDVRNCCISELTIAELKYGVEKSENYEKHEKEVKKVENLFVIIPIYKSFDKYAKEKVKLQKAGNLIPDFDLLIGASSITEGLIMVSNNEKHLSRLKGIQLENWTKPAFNKHL